MKQNIVSCFALVFLLIAVLTKNVEAQYSFVGPTVWMHPAGPHFGPDPHWHHHGPPPPLHWPPFSTWNPPYLPYQTVPPYPGALPLYYQGNIPIYDYTQPIGGNYYGGITYPHGLNGGLSVQVQPGYNADSGYTRSDEIRRLAAMLRKNAKPHQVAVAPMSEERRTQDLENQEKLARRIQEIAKRVEKQRRTWRTVDGDVIKNGVIFGMIDGELGIKNDDGKRFYVNPDRLDGDSRNAYELWKLQFSKNRSNAPVDGGKNDSEEYIAP